MAAADVDKRHVPELLTAHSTQGESPAVSYFLANPTVDKMTDSVARLFLGVQLQCAQCHNHPFTKWKQDEYWGMAAFFSRVRFDGNPQQALRNGGAIDLHENGKGRPLPRPDSAKNLPPKFLQGDQPKIAYEGVANEATVTLSPQRYEWWVEARFDPCYGTQSEHRILEISN